MDIECGPYNAQQLNEEENTTPVTHHQKPMENIEFEELQSVKQEAHEKEDYPVTVNDLVNPSPGINILTLPTHDVAQNACSISELYSNKTTNSKPKPQKRHKTDDEVKNNQAGMGMQRMEETLVMQETSATDNTDILSLSELYPNIISTSKPNPAKRHKTSNVIQKEAAGLESDREEQDTVKLGNDMMEGHSVCIVPQIPEVQNFTEA